MPKPEGGNVDRDDPPAGQVCRVELGELEGLAGDQPGPLAHERVRVLPGHREPGVSGPADDRRAGPEIQITASQRPSNLQERLEKLQPPACLDLSEGRGDGRDRTGAALLQLESHLVRCHALSRPRPKSPVFFLRLAWCWPTCRSGRVLPFRPLPASGGSPVGGTAEAEDPTGNGSKGAAATVGGEEGLVASSAQSKSRLKSGGTGTGNLRCLRSRAARKSLRPSTSEAPTSTPRGTGSDFPSSISSSRAVGRASTGPNAPTSAWARGGS